MPTIAVKHERGLSSTVNVRAHEITVDVREQLGGEDSGPSAVELFVGSLGACVNYFIAQWCERAGVPHAGLETEVTYEYDAKGERIADVKLTIKLPPGFPQERRAGALRVAENCILRNTLREAPPVQTVLAE